MNNVVVKKSGIEGKGVFAARDFKQGEIVLKWDVSNKLIEKQVSELPEKEKKYVSFFKGKYTVMMPPERFVNHSCDANTFTKDFCDVAVRDIKKGEEITGNYADNELPGFEMKCNCKSKNCIGFVRKR